MAFVFVQLDRHGAVDAAAMKQAVEAMPEVVAVYVASGEFDVMLQVIVPDLDAYRDFSLGRLLGVPGIRDVGTSFVIDTPIDARPMSLRHLR